MKNKVDLIYIEATGNIVESLRRWYKKDSVISETSKTFSGQTFDFCKENNLKTLGWSYFTEPSEYHTELISAVSKPKLMLPGGLGYHLSQILFGIRIWWMCLKHRPKYLHVNNGVTHYFMLAPLKLFGIKIVPHFHNTFWAKGFAPQGKISKLLLKTDGWFLKNIAHQVVACSPEIKSQIMEISNDQQCPTHVFKAQFYRKDFDNPLPPPSHDSDEFIIVFAGRIERNKGVFDILEMAEQLTDQKVSFHICGDGGALEELKAALASKPAIKDRVTIHGRLKRPDLLSIYTKGHAVIVPTTSDFCEGLPMAGIEAILLGRPLITSQLSNALDVLGDAIVEAEPENIESYQQAILSLVNDKALYEQKQAGCAPLREQFLDGKDGLTAVLDRTL